MSGDAEQSKSPLLRVNKIQKTNLGQSKMKLCPADLRKKCIFMSCVIRVCNSCEIKNDLLTNAFSMIKNGVVW